MKPLHPFEWLAKACSIVGGLILTALTLMTCYSVVGRNFFEKALVGDFELTAIACGISMAFFMPLCQLQRGNIIVDFFTANRSARFNHRLDRFGDLLMAVIFLLLAWRTARAAWVAQENMGASMLLGFPDWIVLAGMSIPFALTAVIAGAQVFTRFNHGQREAA
jgi:TRAP-type C4-dicarboxylate transport system permease small subunit